MNHYEELAHRFFEEMRQYKEFRPRQDDVSALMRGEMAVLRLLDDEQRRVSAGDLSRLLEMTTSRVAAVLNSLEKKGLIERCADAADRRRVLVALTERGGAICAHKKECARKRLAAVFERLGQEDTDQFIRLIRRIAQISESLGGRAPEGLKQAKEDAYE